MPTTPAFESISLDVLSTITGGCGKKKNCCPCPPPQVEQAAPAPASAGPLVSTNVSVSGYGAPTSQTV